MGPHISTCRDGASAPLSHLERKCRPLWHLTPDLVSDASSIKWGLTHQKTQRKDLQSNTRHTRVRRGQLQTASLWSTPGHTYGGKGLQEHLSKELLLWVQIPDHFSLLPDRDYETL